MMLASFRGREAEAASLIQVVIAEGAASGQGVAVTYANWVAAVLYNGLGRLSRTGFRRELARVHLFYGEWLRREGDRTDAREQLRAAHDIFTAIGMEAFAERARRELLASGGTVRTHSADMRDPLTPQEAQVARLAETGMSNPEIAAQLFLSPRTVEYHLAKVFAKLDITSRRQLLRALPRGTSLGIPTEAILAG
jgi:DNA-binding CsgD family transcriptional regulator